MIPFLPACFVRPTPCFHVEHAPFDLGRNPGRYPDGLARGRAGTEDGPFLLHVPGQDGDHQSRRRRTELLRVQGAQPGDLATRTVLLRRPARRVPEHGTATRRPRSAIRGLYTQTPTHIWSHDLVRGSLDELCTKDRIAAFETPALLLGDER